jgi:glycine/D-amino acid oxidase-like deaminating enzyme
VVPDSHKGAARPTAAGLGADGSGELVTNIGSASCIFDWMIRRRPARVDAMHDETQQSRPDLPKVEPTPGPTEAEMSRIAREAVHQQPDARLDKQLVRMGLMDASEPAEPQAVQQTSRAVAIDPELERLRGELRRTRVILWLLVGVVVILAVVVVVLVFR